MAKRLQHRGGTTSQHSTFTGAVREVTVDTDKNTLVVHDGATAGGHPLATATNFTSTGIDDNATSTAITIGSDERVHINGTAPQSGVRINPADETSGLNIYKTTEDASISLFRNDTSTVNGEIIGSLRGLVNDNNSSGFYERTGEIDFIASSTHTATIRNTDIVFKTMSGTTLLQKMRIAYNGDISFYEDTGTTPKFFWDASAERLGIGTATPTQALDVNGLSYPLVINSTNGNLYKIQFKDNGVNRGYIGCGSSAVFSFADASALEKMRIDSAGNVGIGLTNPTAKLHVNTNSTGRSNVYFSNFDTSSGISSHEVAIGFQFNRSGGGINVSAARVVAGKEREWVGAASNQDGFLAFETCLNESVSEKMRITSSGNVGINETAPLGKVHIKSGDTGVSSVGGDKDELVIENNTHSGITTLAGDSYESGMFFGHTSDTRAGEIYTHYTNQLMTIGTRMSGGAVKFISDNASERMRIGSDGKVLVNTTSNGTESNLNVQGQFGMSTARGFIFETQEGRNGSGFTSITLQFTTGGNGRTCFIESMVGSSAFYLHHIAHKYSGNTTNVLTNDNNGPTVSWSVSNSGSNTGSVYTYVVNFPYGTSHPYAKFKVSLGGYITTPITSPSITFTQ